MRDLHSNKCKYPSKWNVSLRFIVNTKKNHKQREVAISCKTCSTWWKLGTLCFSFCHSLFAPTKIILRFIREIISILCLDLWRRIKNFKRFLKIEQLFRNSIYMTTREYILQLYTSKYILSRCWHSILMRQTCVSRNIQSVLLNAFIVTYGHKWRKSLQ